MSEQNKIYLLMVNDTFFFFFPSGTGSYTAPTICKIKYLKKKKKKYSMFYLEISYNKYFSLKQSDGKALHHQL